MPSKRKEVYSDNYRKPPTEFRFEKGKSGNPRGRPKKNAELPEAGSLGEGIYKID